MMDKKCKKSRGKYIGKMSLEEVLAGDKENQIVLGELFGYKRVKKVGELTQDEINFFEHVKHLLDYDGRRFHFDLYLQQQESEYYLVSRIWDVVGKYVYFYYPESPATIQRYNKKFIIETDSWGAQSFIFK